MCLVIVKALYAYVMANLNELKPLISLMYQETCI